jgi:hypothetical protein
VSETPAAPKAPVFSSSVSNDSSSSSGFKASAYSGAPSKDSAATPLSKAADTAAPAGFKVSALAGSTSQTSASPAGFKVPSFGGSISNNQSSGSGSSIAELFAAKAKAERKAKAKREQYDSDDSEGETEEQWEARYEKEEAEREAAAAKKKQEEEAQKKDGKIQGFSASMFVASTNATPAAQSPFSVSKPASGTTSLFTSRIGSPAPSVLGAPSAEPSPSSNIFGHLSSAASSNNQDESDNDEQEDEGEDEQRETEQSTEDNHSKDDGNKADKSPVPSRRNPFQSEDGSSSEEASGVSESKKQESGASKPSLMSRISFGAPTGDELKEQNSTDTSGNAASKVNGSFETPAKKSGFFFDFSNAGGPKTAPPKATTFAGDQTFKPGTPIKFGASTTDKPLFSLQAPTPSASPSTTDTGSKPAPFAFLTPNAGQSGPGSAASSVFSSRAPTPSSDAADTTEADDEGSSAPQLDLATLTEDEQKQYEVLFHTKTAIAKEQKDKVWKNFARGPLWILKNKETGKALLRMRLPSGATPVNWNLLPGLRSSVAGASKTMVLASRPPEGDGKLTSVYFAMKPAEVAEEFSSVYNANV